MAKTLSNNGIVLNQIIYPQQVSQSIDAFTGAEAYDITVSGSFTVTGSTLIDGNVTVDGAITMEGNVVAPNLTSTAQSNVVTYNSINGQFYYTSSAAISPATASTAISASYAATASYVENAQTASYVLNAVSASYAATASYVALAQTASYVTLAQTASYVNQAVSASYATSASYAVSSSAANSAISASYSTTASFAQNTISASYAVSASHADLADTASYVTLAQTASYVENAQTASYVALAQTASYVNQAVSASYATTASYSNNSTTASYALTASYLEGYISPFPFTGSAQITGSLGVTGSATVNGDLVVNGTASFNVFHTIYNTSSIIFASGSTKFGDTSDDTHQFTGSLYVSGSVTADTFTGTASYATQAATASFVTLAQTASYVTLAQTASYVNQAVSASFASTASYVANAQTASYVTLAQTASYVANAQTASYVAQAVSASYAATASFVANAQTASYVTLAQTASYVATASYSNNSLSSSYALTASHVTGIVAAFPYTGSAQITGSLGVTGSVDIYNSGSTVLSVNGSTGALITVTDTNSGALLTVATGSTNILVVDSSLVTTITGSLNVQNGVTASLFGTASWAQNATTASFVTTAQTASYVLNAVSSSFATTSSYAQNAATASFVTTAQTASYVLNAVSASFASTASYVANAISASFASTASYVNQLNQTVNISGSLNATGSVTIYKSGSSPLVVSGSQGPLLEITDSVSGSLWTIYTGSSPIFDVSSDRTMTLSGSATITGSLTVQNGITGSLFGTASWAQNATTASFVTTAQTASYVLNAISASRAISSSNSDVAASIYVTGASEAGVTHYFPMITDVGITPVGTKALYQSTISINGSNVFINSGAGTLNATASYATKAVSASFASTASYVNQLNQTVNISGSLFATGSVDIYKSGSTVFAVSGSNGPLFDVTDVVSGSLFTVWTGSTPILQVNSGLTTTITGSLDVQNGITGSLFGTASYATQALTASYAVSASYEINYETSSSYAETASIATSASYALSALSSSHAETASLSDRTLQTDILAINQTGFTIEKGMVVRITGSNNSSDIPRITTASYETDGVSANTLGIATQQITNGSQGFVITEGVLTGIDTTNYISGQLIFLGASGAITGSAPQAPLHTVRLGQVIRQQSNNGSIHVRIDNGYELGELHDIYDTTTTASYGDLLVKSGSLWTNSNQLTGSYGLTGSLTATSFTGSLEGTASYATQALSASFASTASFVNPLVQKVNLTGSLHITSSLAQTSSSIQITLPSGSSRQDYSVPVTKYKQFSYLTTTRPVYQDDYINLGYDATGNDFEMDINTDPASGRVQVHAFCTTATTVTATSDLIVASVTTDIYPNGINSDSRLEITVHAGLDPNYPFYKITAFRSNTTYGGNISVLVERFFPNN